MGWAAAHRGACAATLVLRQQRRDVLGLPGRQRGLPQRLWLCRCMQVEAWQARLRRRPHAARHCGGVTRRGFAGACRFAGRRARTCTGVSLALGGLSVGVLCAGRLSFGLVRQGSKRGVDVAQVEGVGRPARAAGTPVPAVAPGVPRRSALRLSWRRAVILHGGRLCCWRRGGQRALGRDPVPVAAPGLLAGAASGLAGLCAVIPFMRRLACLRQWLRFAPAYAAAASMCVGRRRPRAMRRCCELGSRAGAGRRWRQLAAEGAPAAWQAAAAGRHAAEHIQHTLRRTRRRLLRVKRRIHLPTEGDISAVPGLLEVQEELSKGLQQVQ